MKRYRLVEIVPEDGKRDGKRIRTTIFSGPDKETFKAAIDAYYQQPPKPWRETAYYYGSKQIYAYEL